ncbi:hypothetical protein [Limnobaculum parvum]|uniref:hypothetical protein n=1 Tax=Limnobaculum parvum TaxID=2172103 RepID=UPI001300A31E|nr:hypothetical protein [Limnobaculum parvum]
MQSPRQGMLAVSLGFSTKPIVGRDGRGGRLGVSQRQTGKACLNSASAGPQGETPQGVS